MVNLCCFQVSLSQISQSINQLHVAIIDAEDCMELVCQMLKWLGCIMIYSKYKSILTKQ